jgi:hypothetical protein
MTLPLLLRLVGLLLSVLAVGVNSVAWYIEHHQKVKKVEMVKPIENPETLDELIGEIDFQI